MTSRRYAIVIGFEVRGKDIVGLHLKLIRGAFARWPIQKMLSLCFRPVAPGYFNGNRHNLNRVFAQC